jgi:hypothetical protein
LKNANELSFTDFEKLLTKDAFIVKNQLKWFKKLSSGKIEILEQPYNILVNENKRKLIYNKNNKLIGTKPHRIDINKNIVN